MLYGIQQEGKYTYPKRLAKLDKQLALPAYADREIARRLMKYAGWHNYSTPQYLPKGQWST
jgi:hypothetical protein